MAIRPWCLVPHIWGSHDRMLHMVMNVAVVVLRLNAFCVAAGLGMV